MLEKFEGHDKSVYSVAFSPDGKSLVSGSLDQTLKIWDLSPATLHILSVSPDHNVKPEVIVTRKFRHSFSGHQDYVLTVGYPGLTSSIGRVDPLGRPINDPNFNIDWVVSGGKDRHVIFWNGNDGSKAGEDSYSPLLSMSGHKNSGIFTLIKSYKHCLRPETWTIRDRFGRPKSKNLESFSRSSYTKFAHITVCIKFGVGT